MNLACHHAHTGSTPLMGLLMDVLVKITLMKDLKSTSATQRA